MDEVHRIAGSKRGGKRGKGRKAAVEGSASVFRSWQFCAPKIEPKSGFDSESRRPPRSNSPKSMFDPTLFTETAVVLKFLELKSSIDKIMWIKGLRAAAAASLVLPP